MKFKNIKKKARLSARQAKKEKLPSNSRTIPAFTFPKLTSKSLLTLYSRSLNAFIIIVFILTAVIVSIDLYDNVKAKQSIDGQREKLSRELEFWEDFISKHNNYRDAYLQASVLEYKLGNTPKAKIYVEKGLTLDPNSVGGRKLEQFLVSK